MKYYLISKKNLPIIEKDDLLVGHVTSCGGYETVYPKIECIKELKSVEGNDHVSPVCLYEIEMEPFEHRFNYGVNFESYFFRLSHHDLRSREHYDDFLKKGFDVMSYEYQMGLQRWARLRMLNGVEGRIYKDQSKAQKSFDMDLKLRNQIEQESKERRFEEYKKLKSEFEPC